MGERTMDVFLVETISHNGRSEINRPIGWVIPLVFGVFTMTRNVTNVVKRIEPMKMVHSGWAQKTIDED